MRRVPRSLFQHDLKDVFGQYAPCFGSLCRIQVSALPNAEGQQRVFRCPYGAHTVLFDPQDISPDDSQPSSPQTIHVSLYEQRQLSKMRHRMGIKKVTSSAQSERAIYNHYSLFDTKGGDWSESWQLHQDHFLPSIQSGQEDRRVSVIATSTLGPRELMFVPRNYLLTLTASSSEAKETTVCMMCLLDASNLNIFRGHLQSMASVSAAHDRLYTFLSPSRAEAGASSMSQVTAGGMLLSMDRHVPAPVTIKQYLVPPSTNADASATAEGDSRGSDASNSANIGTETPAVVTTNRKDRRKQRSGTAGGSAGGGGSGAGGGTSDFKSWQNQVQWKILIDSLVLPPVSPVRISEIGRSHVTIKFNHSFGMVEDDQALFGFHMILCRWQDGTEGVLLDDNLRLLRDSTTGTVIARPATSLLSPEGMLQSTARDPNLRCEERQLALWENGKPLTGGSGFTPKQLLIPSMHIGNNGHRESAAARAYEVIMSYEWRLSHLEPSSHYQFKIAMMYGNKRGPYSRWSPRVHTSAISAPEAPEPPTLEEVHDSFNSEHPFFPIPDTQRNDSLTSSYQNPSTFVGFLPAKISTKVIPATNGFVNVDNVPEKLSAEVLIRKEEDDGGKPVLGYFVYQYAVPYAELQRHFHNHDVVDRLMHHFSHNTQYDTNHFEFLSAGEQDRLQEEHEHRLQLFLGELLLREMADQDDSQSRKNPTGHSWQSLGVFPFESVVKRGEWMTRDVYQPKETPVRRIVVRNLQPDTFYAFKVCSIVTLFKFYFIIFLQIVIFCLLLLLF